MKINVSGIFAHPGDAEITCAGSLFLLKKAGYSIHIADIASVDKGTTVHSREEIISIRNTEARETASLNGRT
jgi:LmbE family N-acetylglucosaminyl deacetylase